MDDRCTSANLLTLGPPKSETPLTLADLAWEWLDTRASTVKKLTYQKYESLIHCHIAQDAIGSAQLQTIDGQQLSAYAKRKLSKDQLTAKTVNDILVVLNAALDYGETAYNIQRPRLHYIKEEPKPARVLSRAEQQTLEAYLWRNIDPCRFGVLLALYTGIRVGELCALTWDDFWEDAVHISKTLYRAKDGEKSQVESVALQDGPARRMIPLPSFLLPCVEELRAEGPVLRNRNDRQVEPRLMQITFARYLTKCGLPKLHFSVLRNTFAVRCVEAGFDIKVLSELLGHADVKTTLNKYVYPTMAQKRQNMELLKPMVG